METLDLTLSIIAAVVGIGDIALHLLGKR